MLTGADIIVYIDATGMSPSPFVSFQVNLPAKERHVLRPQRAVIEGSQRYLTDSVNGSTLCRYPSSGFPGARSEESADTSLPAIPSPPIFPCVTPSLIASIIDCEDVDWFVAIDIDIDPSLQLCMPPSDLHLSWRVPP